MRKSGCAGVFFAGMVLAVALTLAEAIVLDEERASVSDAHSSELASLDDLNAASHGAAVEDSMHLKLAQDKEQDRQTASMRLKTKERHYKKASEQNTKASEWLLAQLKATDLEEEQASKTTAEVQKAKQLTTSLQKPISEAPDWQLHFRRPEDQTGELQGPDLAEMMEQGRRGGALKTSSSFAMASGNRAGNSEDDEEDKLGSGQDNEATTVDGERTTCTAKSCPIDGYLDRGTSMANQIAGWIGQKKDAGNNQKNADKLIKTLDHLVKGNNLISQNNNAQPFQLKFAANDGNKFTVTGCNKPTGEACGGTSEGLVKAAHGTCLEAPQRSTNGGKVHMWACDPNNQNQQWTYTASTKQLKATHGICLDAPQRSTNGGKVHMWACDPNNQNQQWTYTASTKQLEATHGICLDAPQRSTNGGKVHMWACDSNNQNQKWNVMMPGAGSTCHLTVTIDFQACPGTHYAPASTCSKCTHGNALLALQVQLDTDVPACKTWFVKADAAIRSITTSLRTFWLVDRINLCKNA